MVVLFAGFRERQCEATNVAKCGHPVDSLRYRDNQSGDLRPTSVELTAVASRHGAVDVWETPRYWLRLTRTISVSPGQSQNCPDAERDLNNALTSSSNS